MEATVATSGKRKRTPIALSKDALSCLPIAGPAYDRSKVTIGIVHIGVGGFHRAHQARYTDAVLASGEEGALQWGISGVGLMPSDIKMRDVMAKQDCLYTLWEQGAADHVRVIGSHCEFIFAPEQHAAVVERLSSSSVKVVSLTVTEKGYCSNLSTGALDTALSAVSSDIEKIKAGDRTDVSTALGYLTLAAQRRKESSAPPLAILSCDNVQANGDKMARCVLEFAEAAVGPELTEYIKSAWTFPNSMVDRITPMTTDVHRAALTDSHGVEDAWPVVCEDFIQWVVEDKFPAGRPPWEKVLGGTCLMVEDVMPYELMKLRLLNGSHQAVGYPGVLAGYRAVDDAMADKTIFRYIEQYMDAVGQSVPPVPGVDLKAYKAKLRERFGNKALKDQLLRLTEDARNRIQVACLPCLEGLSLDSTAITPVAALLACWLRYLADSRDEKGAEFMQSKDTAKEELQPIALGIWALLQSAEDPKDTSRTIELVEKFLRAAFPNMAWDAGFPFSAIVARTASCLSEIYVSSSVRAMLAKLDSGS